MFIKIFIGLIIVNLFGYPILFAQDCDNNGSQTGSYGHGGSDSSTNDGNNKDWTVRRVHSADPNDIIGPSGIQEKRWVSVKDKLGYRIRFENNYLVATAPAQNIFIRQAIDPRININTLRLGSFGFGFFNFEVPPNTSFYTTRLDVRDSLGIFVDVIAGIDITKNEIFWTFKSIDPKTGRTPEDALVGLLLVNDSTITRFNDTLPNRGEGYVTYEINAKTTAKTGDTAAAKAIIVFDTNEEITTNTWVNAIDALAPTSKMLTAKQSRDSILLTWSGIDDTRGTGVQSYAVYVSENDQPFQLYRNNIENTSTTFAGTPGSTYSFFSIATDKVGNTEALKKSAEVTIKLVNCDESNGPCSENICIGTPPLNLRSVYSAALHKITSTWTNETDLKGYVVKWNIKGSAVVKTDTIKTGIARHEIVLNCSAGKIYIIQLAKICASGNISEWSTVEADNVSIPAISTTGVLSFCTGKDILLTSSVATGNQWYLNNIAIPGAIAKTWRAITAGIYTVKVTNANGCTLTSAAVRITAVPLPAIPTIKASGPLVFCTGSSVTLTASSSAGNQWFKNGRIITGATGKTYKAETAGIYTVSTANTLGCSVTSAAVTTVVNTLPAVPKVSITGTPTLCNGGTVQLVSSAITGNQWYKDNRIITGATAKTLHVIATGSYLVKVKNTSGCEVVSQAVNVPYVNLPAKPVISYSGNLKICKGASLILNSSATTGNQWFKDGLPISGAKAATLKVTATGKYAVQVTITGGCTAMSNTVIVTVYDPPAVPVISTNVAPTICAGTEVILSSGVRTGNQWYLNNTAIPGATAATYKTGIAGKYHVTVSNVYGCTAASVPVTVKVIPLPTRPTLKAAGQTSFCEGNSVVLNTTSTIGNQWMKDGQPIAGATSRSLTVTAKGKYSVLLTSSNGCTVLSDTITVNVFANPLKPVISWDGKKLVTKTGYTNYKWFKNNTIVTGSVSYFHQPTEPGVYSVQVTDRNNCTAVSDNFTHGSASTINYKALPDRVSIYPNPARDLINIIIVRKGSISIKARLFDNNGKMVKEQQINSSQSLMQTNNLPAGIYQLVLIEGEHNSSHKIVIVR